MTDFIVELFGAFGGGYDHLAEDGFLFFQLGELILEIVILLLLGDHAHLQTSVEAFDEGVGGVHDFVVGVFDFVLHGFEILPEKFNQLVVLLEVLVGLAHEVLDHAEVAGRVGGVLVGGRLIHG